MFEQSYLSDLEALIVQVSLVRLFVPEIQLLPSFQAVLGTELNEKIRQNKHFTGTHHLQFQVLKMWRI